MKRGRQAKEHADEQIQWLRFTVIVHKKDTFTRSETNKERSILSKMVSLKGIIQWKVL